MKRKIDIEKNPDQLNQWILKSIKLFSETSYLDNVLEVYPLQIEAPERLDEVVRRQIIMDHQSRQTRALIEALGLLSKFPYDDPVWYLLKNVKGCLDKNPKQVRRIADTLYSMTADETVVRLESAPKLNQQMGPMFGAWLKRKFNLLKEVEFIKSKEGIFVLDASEEEGLAFVKGTLKQDLRKRPDLVAKVDKQYVIGEAKWVGQSGGNQNNQVGDVLEFCSKQRGSVTRVGIIDGFPWALYGANGEVINDKVAVSVQESEYDIVSALLLEKYLSSL